MFNVEYRTISSKAGNVYPSRTAYVGSHKAVSAEEAVQHILRTTPNVEIVSVQYIGAL